MKRTTLFLTPVGIIAGCIGLLLASAHAAQGGTDILHLSLVKAVTPTELATNAVGKVELHQNRQGHADNQRLRLHLRHLETNSAYHLFAWLGDDTNATYVGPMSSGATGLAHVDYWSVASRHGVGAPRGHTPLPAILNPVSQIRALTVTDVSTQAVVTADLTMPEKLEYLVHRHFGNDGVEPSAQAALHLHSTVRSTRARVDALGLMATNNYVLTANGIPVMTNTAGARGRLVFKGALQNPGDILDVHSLAVLNSASNSVLSVTLP